MPSSIAPDSPATRLESDLNLNPDFDPDEHPIIARHWFGLELRDLWWRQLWLGHRLPVEPGVILIDGGRP